MPRLPLAPEPVARFRRDLTALGPEPDRLGIAVSGGPDSLALLLLAHAALPGRVHAATVDHALRKESMIEALQVEDLCARIGCPHDILSVMVPDGSGGLQAEARKARYAALEAWASRRSIRFLATAHHADDQAETLLMRLQRGSGIAGLSGIRPIRKRSGLVILRPLLGWTKAELVHLVAEAGIDAADDPSNHDPRFDRAAVRAFLRDTPSFEAKRLARTASALREADEAIGWIVDRLLEDRCTFVEGECRIDPSGLPREVRRRLLVRAIVQLRREHGMEPPWTGNEDVEGLLSLLEEGKSGTRGGVMATGGTYWRIRIAPARRPTRG